MNDTDKLILYIAIPVFVGIVSLTMYWYWLGDKMFKLLAKRHPKYYEENGKPLYFADPVSNLWAGLYLMLLLIRGVPKDFPEDAGARSLAQKTRRTSLILFLCLTAVLGVVYYHLLLTQ